MFYEPKSEEIEKIFKRLMRFNTSTISPQTAQVLGRDKTLRVMRRKQNLFIANDRKNGTSIIHVPNKIRITKNGKRFFFEFMH